MEGEKGGLKDDLGRYKDSEGEYTITLRDHSIAFSS